MSQTPNLADVRDWAIAAEEPSDPINCLEKIPARLGMIDADLASLPASLVDFERIVAGKGYALVGAPEQVDANGRRMDSRIRALLRRFWTAFDGSCSASPAVRDRWSALMDLIEAQEPGLRHPREGRSRRNLSLFPQGSIRISYALRLSDGDKSQCCCQN